MFAVRSHKRSNGRWARKMADRKSRTALITIFSSLALLVMGCDTPQGVITTNVGTVWETRSLETQCELYNSANRVAEISGFGLSCNCLNVAPNRISLKPGERVEITASVNLTGAFSSTAETMPFRVSVSPLCDPPDAVPNKWNITGKVLPSPISPIADGTVVNVVYGQPKCSFPLILRRPVQSVDAVSITPEVATVDSVRFRDSDSYLIVLEVSSDLIPGRYDCDIEITPNCLAVSPPALTAKLKLDVPHGVVPHPGFLNLGFVSANTESETEVSLLSNCGAFRVLSTKCSSPSLTVVADRTSGNKSIQRFRVRGRINGNYHTSEIHFRIEELSTRETYSLAVPVAGKVLN